MVPVPNATLVLLWSTQFSGTTWVSRVLDEAPSVFMRHEVLLDKAGCLKYTSGDVENRKDFIMRMMWGLLGESDLRTFFQRGYGGSRPTSPAWFAMKCMECPSPHDAEECYARRVLKASIRGFVVQQGQEGGMRSLLWSAMGSYPLARHLRIVFLRRHNILAHAMSSPSTQGLMAKKVTNFALFRRNFARLVERHVVMRRNMDMVKASRKVGGLLATYELLVADPSAFVEVFSFIGAAVSWDPSRRVLVNQGRLFSIKFTTKSHKLPPLAYLDTRMVRRVQWLCARERRWCSECMLNNTCVYDRSPQFLETLAGHDFLPPQDPGRHRS